MLQRSLVLVTMVCSIALSAQTEEEFAQFVIAEFQDFQEQLDVKAAQMDQLKQSLNAASDDDLRRVYRDALVNTLQEYDQIKENRVAFQLASEIQANTEFGKSLRIILRGFPMPGATDFAIGMMLAPYTLTDDGPMALTADLTFDLFPDQLQIATIVVAAPVGAALFTGTVAILEIQEIDQERTQWVNTYNDMIQAWDAEDEVIRTHHNVDTAIAGVNNTISAILNNEHYSDAGEAGMRSQARHLKDMQEVQYHLNQLKIQASFIKAGDTNDDHKVDDTDLQEFMEHYGMPSGAIWRQGDFDADGDVDFTDFTYLNENWTG